jgi:xanthine/uracil permease
VLVAIKVLHTIVWALFVACILGIFVAARAGRFGVALVLIAVVLGEVLVLVLNRMRCPLTDVAGRYTDERVENFDIYLPRFVAKYNQEIFGALYLAGIAYTLIAWLLRRFAT